VITVSEACCIICAFIFYLRGYATVRHLSACPSVCDVQVGLPWSHRLEYFENNY